MSAFTKILALLLVLTIAATGILFMKLNSLTSDVEGLRASISQMKTDNDAKLKEMSTALDDVKSKLAGAAPAAAAPVAAPADQGAAAPAAPVAAPVAPAAEAPLVAPAPAAPAAAKPAGQ